MRLLPQLALLTVCLSFPAFDGFLFGGRDVTWFSILYNWFALAALASTGGTTLACLSVIFRLMKFVLLGEFLSKSPNRAPKVRPKNVA